MNVADDRWTCPEEEQWKPVPGYEGLYEVSDLGRVKTLPRWHVRNERIHKAAPDGNGYPSVRLRRDGQTWSTRVHVIVMLAFVGDRPDGYHVRHLDGIATNNRLSNLAYGTPSENQYDRIVHGTHHEANKTHCARGHAFDAANTYVIPSRPKSRYCRACQAINRDIRRTQQRAMGVPVT